MKRLLASFALIFMFGCTTCNKYAEGTMTQLGVYAPVDGSIYGCVLHCTDGDITL